jgi:nitrogen PTS system EIIA component
MDIIEVLKDESCTASLEARDKEDCLAKLAKLVAKSLPDFSITQIDECLHQREKMGSTGFADGIAIPHGRLAGLEEFVMCIAVMPRGIDFDSADGKLTRIFFVVVGPDTDEASKEHLQILAQISRISRLPKARRQLLQAPTAFVLKETFTRFVSDSAINGAPHGKDKLLLIILYDQEFLEDILGILVERGIRGATIMESRGMRDDLSNIPLFSNFFNFLGDTSDASRTILTTVKESDVASIIEEVEVRMGDLDSHTGAVVLALDVFSMKGSMQM